jgi:uncharacterized protein (DUF433 family)
MTSDASEAQTDMTSTPRPRITRDPHVGMVVGQVGAGRSIEQILEDFPYLEREDALEALQYAAWLSH